MLDNMSEAQRSVLQSAAAREDRLLQPPGNARGAVTKSLAARLSDAGWAKEIKASNGAPVWRRNPATGGQYALKLTPKRLKALAAASNGSDGSESSWGPVATETAPPNARARKSARSVGAKVVAIENGSSDAPPVTTLRAPRSELKLGKVLARLSAEAGAAIGELMTMTGWLDHTTRAALTGLRRRGYALSLTRHERDGASVYRISAIGGEPTK